jgi:hypothetical protein
MTDIKQAREYAQGLENSINDFIKKHADAFSEKYPELHLNATISGISAFDEKKGIYPKCNIWVTINDNL